MAVDAEKDEEEAPAPTAAPVEEEVSEEPLPETGEANGRPSADLIIIVASIALIGILFGGALINQKRHQA